MSVNWEELQKFGILVSREVTSMPRLVVSHYEMKKKIEITEIFAHNEPSQVAVLLTIKIKFYYNLVFMLPKYI
jgi:hypothetical protein